MRVAVFTDNDFDKVNGVTTTLTALVKGAPPDISPRIYTASTLGVDAPDHLALAAAGVPIPFHGETRMYWPPCGALHRRIVADGVHVLHLTTPGPLGLCALRIARRTGLPLVGSLHTDVEAYTAALSGSSRLGQWVGRYAQWIYAHCHTILVASESARALLVTRGVEATRIDVWPIGVDTDLFRPERRSERLRDEWRVSDRRPAVLYVGRMSREKGVLRLPAISRSLEVAGLAHRLVFAGDGPLRRELAGACPDAVFAGEIGREAVATMFASSDVLVFPSEADTGGNVVLEAQASGLPTVVSGRGSSRQHVARNLSGLICDDAAGWTLALGSLVRDERLRRDMGTAARTHALSRRWDLTLAPVFSAYRRAAQRLSPLLRPAAADRPLA